MTSDHESGEGRPRYSLADKINQLFASIHPPGRGPYSDREVVEWLADHEADGPTISRNYLHMMRTGERDNPTVDHLRAIARFFGVNPSFLLDDEPEMYRDLELLAALKEQDVRTVALRAHQLAPEMRSWLARTVSDLPLAQPRTSTKQPPAPQPGYSE
ncbi:MAG: XRE family transcriptional regulator [Pseudonocardiaceae bacterium]